MLNTYVQCMHLLCCAPGYRQQICCLSSQLIQIQTQYAIQIMHHKSYIWPLQENSLFCISHPHADFLPTWSSIIAVNLTFLFIIYPVIALAALGLVDLTRFSLFIGSFLLHSNKN